MVQITNDEAMKLITRANALAAQASLLATEILVCISDQPSVNELMPTLRKTNDVEGIKELMKKANEIKKRQMRKAQRVKRAKKVKAEEAPKTEEAK